MHLAVRIQRVKRMLRCVRLGFLLCFFYHLRHCFLQCALAGQDGYFHWGFYSTQYARDIKCHATYMHALPFLFSAHFMCRFNRLRKRRLARVGKIFTCGASYQRLF